MPSKVIRWEDREQEALYEWRDLHAHLLPGLSSMFAIPNGQRLAGTRLQRICAAQRAKRMGLTPGVSDNLLPVARGHWHGLFIELKRSKMKGMSSGTESPDQKAFRAQMTRQGYLCTVSHGWLEAAEFIKGYYRLPPMPRPVIVEYPGTGRLLIGATPNTDLARAT